MSAKFTIKRGDFGSGIRSTIQDRDGADIDFVGATVVFCYQEVLSGGSLGTAVRRTDAEIDSYTDTTATVSYVWVEADTLEVGKFRGEWEVTFADGSIRTFPTGGFIEINIVSDVS